MPRADSAVGGISHKADRRSDRTNQTHATGYPGTAHGEILSDVCPTHFPQENFSTITLCGYPLSMNGKRLLLYFIFLPGSFAAGAQVLTGMVTDSVTGNLLPGASVFINASSIGVMTTDSGTFDMSTQGISEFDLIVSYVGYATARVHVSNAGVRQTIRMQAKQDVLDEVTVLTADKNGWNRWGELFKQVFIGTTAASKSCSIIHPQRIRFHFSKKDQTLFAFVTGPVTVINKYLGYRIEFDLTRFEIDFNTRRAFYKGYPRFIPLPGNLSRKRYWEKNREHVYEGSFMQFLRALCRGPLPESRYSVRQVVRQENVERRRVQMLTGNFDSASMLKFPRDSLRYYSRIQQQPFIRDYLSADKMGDSLFVERGAHHQVLLRFDGMIQVVYNGKKEDPEYASQVTQSPPQPEVAGLLTLLRKPVLVTQSGLYFDPEDVFLDGYWGWSEKVANQLPVDYEAP